MSLFHLRSQMALVGQEPRLFAGSIRENVCFGLQDVVPTEKIYEALKLANAMQFVDSLPQVTSPVPRKISQQEIPKQLPLLDSLSKNFKAGKPKSTKQKYDKKLKFIIIKGNFSFDSRTKKPKKKKKKKLEKTKNQQLSEKFSFVFTLHLLS